MSATFFCLPFAELTVAQLHAILKLRSEVFVVEQNCVFLDIDAVDAKAYHFFALDKEGNCIANARLIPAYVVYNYCSIGRVVTHAAYRKLGLGRQLMKQSIEKCYLLFGENETIKIGAQLYLKEFYSSFGFKQIGEEYIEDGIPHIHMLLTK